MPTDNVSGQLQFKVDITSTNQDGKITHTYTYTQTERFDFTEVLTKLDSAVWVQISTATLPLRSHIKNSCIVMVSVTAEAILTFNDYIYFHILDVTPESILGAAALNGPPGTPSDDEDLPHPLPLSSGILYPTHSQCFRRNGEGGGTLSPDNEICSGSLDEETLPSLNILQRTFSEQLDAIEAPKGPGERPMGAASPKLSSSFPTHTRLSDMLHIDSDEDEERSAGIDPIPPALNGLIRCPVMLHKPTEEPEELEEPQEEVGLESEVETLSLGTEVALEPEFLPSSVAPQVETASLMERQDEGEEEEGQGPSEELATEVDISSMASDCGPMHMSAAQVNFLK